MRQRYNDNTARSKPQENQLGILKIYTFCQKIRQILQVQESAAGVTYLSIYENAPKNCCIFPLKVATTLL